MDTSPIQAVVQTGFNWSNLTPWFLGALGAITRVCLVNRNGKPLNLYEAVATLISGTVFAGTGGEIAGMVGMGGVTIGLSAYFAGIFGMVAAEAVFKLKGTGGVQ